MARTKNKIAPVPENRYFSGYLFSGIKILCSACNFVNPFTTNLKILL
jgi:hypothetical protein